MKTHGRRRHFELRIPSWGCRMESMQGVELDGSKTDCVRGLHNGQSGHMARPQGVMGMHAGKMSSWGFGMSDELCSLFFLALGFVFYL
jgi:hypothetical protein